MAKSRFQEILESRHVRLGGQIRKVTGILMAVIAPALGASNGLILSSQSTAWGLLHSLFAATFALLLVAALAAHLAARQGRVYLSCAIIEIGVLLYTFGVYALRADSDVPCMLAALMAVVFAYLLDRRLLLFVPLVAVALMGGGLVLNTLQLYTRLTMPPLLRLAEDLFVLAAVMVLARLLLVRKHDEVEADLRATLRLHDQQTIMVEGISGAIHQLGSQMAELQGSIEALSQQASRQAEFAAAATDVLNQVDKGTRAAADIAERVLGEARDSHGAANGGLSSAQAFAQSVGKAFRQVESGRDFAESAADKAQEIDTVIVYLQDVVAALQVVSLNASLEAVRAGESGAGFSVVVTELLRLLEETRANVGRSRELLSAMKADAERSAAAARSGSGSARQGMESLDQATEVLRGIAGRLQHLSELAMPLGSAVLEERERLAARRAGRPHRGPGRDGAHPAARSMPVSPALTLASWAKVPLSFSTVWRSSADACSWSWVRRTTSADGPASSAARPAATGAPPATSRRSRRAACGPGPARPAPRARPAGPRARPAPPRPPRRTASRGPGCAPPRSPAPAPGPRAATRSAAAPRGARGPPTGDRSPAPPRPARPSSRGRACPARAPPGSGPGPPL